MDTSIKFDNELKRRGWEFNSHNYRYGYRINDNIYLLAFFDKRKNKYMLRGTSKFNTSLGGNSVGISFEFNNMHDLFDKVEELKLKKNKSIEENFLRNLTRNELREYLIKMSYSTKKSLKNVRGDIKKIKK